MDKADKFGLSVALATPFNSDSSVNLTLYAAHAQRCLDGGCNSVTAMGTTGENASLGLDTREELLGSLQDGGITGEQLVVGIAACDPTHAMAQIREAIEFNASHILLPPPFYFKGVSQSGIQSWFAEIMRTMGSAMPATILYHIPSQTAAEISPELVCGLRSEFGDIIAGVKDSGGQWEHTHSLLRSHSDIAILIGDERQLGAGIRAGAQGSICGVANIYPEKMRAIIESQEDDNYINSLVDALVKYPIIPALKALISHSYGEPEWNRVRPPLSQIEEGDLSELIEACTQLS